ncbi:MFS transporter [Mycolicibacterium sp. CAU 1645]|uniref:MFS transporter n=2 Tax=Mycolicibacterium arenosum TaxID=2952157 RepID=A0ABT1LWE5_9MYCO|nr:MFS transporter [Mycolicibacterium sp. CAU 1645]
MIGTTMPSPMYALYAERLHFAVLTTSVVFATYAAGVLAALLVFGSWSDAVGRRPVLFAGIGFAVLSGIVFLVADSVGVLLIGRVLSGLSAGLFTGTATAAVIEAAPEEWKSRAAAVASMANIGGLGLGPFIAGALVQYAPSPLHLSFVLHLALLTLAAVAVAVVPETSKRQGRIGFQRLAVPREARAVFVPAAIAAFCGFAVMGLFNAVVPTFVALEIGIPNHFLGGFMVTTIFGASAVTQLFAVWIPPRLAVAVGSAVLIVGLAVLAAALWVASLPALIAAGVIAGVGQGISFGRGLAAIAERTPQQRLAEVSSTYFVVAYVGISLPVIGDGFAAQIWGLREAGVAFAVAAAVLVSLCLALIVWTESRSRNLSRTT